MKDSEILEKAIEIQGPEFDPRYGTRFSCNSIKSADRHSNQAELLAYKYYKFLISKDLGNREGDTMESFVDHSEDDEGTFMHQKRLEMLTEFRDKLITQGR